MAIGVAALLLAARALLAFDSIELLHRVTESFPGLRLRAIVSFLVTGRSGWHFVSPQFLQSIFADAKNRIAIPLIVRAHPHKVGVADVLQVESREMEIFQILADGAQMAGVIGRANFSIHRIAAALTFPDKRR
jgi:hypothetical protein